LNSIIERRRKIEKEEPVKKEEPKQNKDEFVEYDDNYYINLYQNVDYLDQSNSYYSNCDDYENEQPSEQEINSIIQEQETGIVLPPLPPKPTELQSNDNFCK